MRKEKKKLGLDSQGIQKTMTMKNYLSDGAGQIALNGMSGLIGMLTYFIPTRWESQRQQRERSC